jgi:hypothetical protein
VVSMMLFESHANDVYLFKMKNTHVQLRIM